MFIVLILGATLPFFIVPLFYMESKFQGRVVPGRVFNSKPKLKPKLSPNLSSTLKCLRSQHRLFSPTPCACHAVAA